MSYFNSIIVLYLLLLFFPFRRFYCLTQHTNKEVESTIKFTYRSLILISQCPLYMCIYIFVQKDVNIACVCKPDKWHQICDFESFNNGNQFENIVRNKNNKTKKPKKKERKEYDYKRLFFKDQLQFQGTAGI